RSANSFVNLQALLKRLSRICLSRIGSAASGARFSPEWVPPLASYGDGPGWIRRAAASSATAAVTCPHREEQHSSYQLPHRRYQSRPSLARAERSSHPSLSRSEYWPRS